MFLKLVAIIFISIIVGYLLLVGVYCIPTQEIDKNLKESLKILDNEGSYPEKISGYYDSRLDNWTDSIMLLTAVHENDSPAYVSAALNARSSVSEKKPYEVYIQIYKEKSKDNLQTTTYGRYWHGYLVLLKPLLYFFNLGEIRYLNICVQMLLFSAIVMLLTAKKKVIYIIPILLGWLFINPISTMLSLQFTTITMLVFIQFIIFLLMDEKYKNNSFLVAVHFLLAGILTSYMDLLTFPLLTLALPLAFWVALDCKNGILKNVFRVVKYSIIWGIGYGGMWAGKWTLGSVVSGTNILKEAADQAAFRSGYSAADGDFTYGKLIEKVFNASNDVIIYGAIIALIAMVVWGCYKKTIHFNLGLAISYAIIFLMPFVWYAALGNHSYWHFWFTFRELVICLYAVLMFGAVSVNKDCNEIIGCKEKVSSVLK